ncbi:hypothetical protein GGR52DRAFT_2346 [Hypoxylon sp. FL1284]|nr:hypothetical protein GGR52DRAFT_2346 [Hypoxylon sp. FL1284]
MCFGSSKKAKSNSSGKPSRPVKVLHEPRYVSRPQCSDTRPSNGNPHQEFPIESPNGCNGVNLQANPTSVCQTTLVHELSGTGIRRKNQHIRDEQRRLNNVARSSAVYELSATSSRARLPSNIQPKRDQASHLDLDQQLRGQERVEKNAHGRQNKLGKENGGKREGKDAKTLKTEPGEGPGKTAGKVSKEGPQESTKDATKQTPKDTTSEVTLMATPKQEAKVTKISPKQTLEETIREFPIPPKSATKASVKDSSHKAGDTSSHGVYDSKRHAKQPTRGHGRKHHDGIQQERGHRDGRYHDAGHPNEGYHDGGQDGRNEEQGGGDGGQYGECDGGANWTI